MSKSIGRNSFTVYQSVKILATALLITGLLTTASAQTTTTAETIPTPADTEATTTTNPAQETSVQDEPTSVALPHGVLYQILKPGTGPESSTTQSMLLHYDLFWVNGKKIESSREAEIPQPVTLRPGQGDFIPGAEAAIKGMKVGEIRKMYIPADQAYGTAGKPPLIQPDTPLVFIMELVNIK